MGTKIVIVRFKELIYGTIFVVLAILLIVLLVVMLTSNKKKNEHPEPVMNYETGVYNSTLLINDQALNLEVVVDDNTISDVRLTNISESIEILYPLLSTTLDNINTQLSSDVPLNNLTYSAEQRYTSALLIDAIETALDNDSVSEASSEQN
ncbi:MAG: hypothetical protein K0R15_1113 [Clostridiales bacterium]|jgi:hypothetical protein|nr:hypothetical protein [Clostridiales bacterium]